MNEIEKINLEIKQIDDQIDKLKKKSAQLRASIDAKKPSKQHLSKITEVHPFEYIRIEQDYNKDNNYKVYYDTTGNGAWNAMLILVKELFTDYQFVIRKSDNYMSTKTTPKRKIDECSIEQLNIASEMITRISTIYNEYFERIHPLQQFEEIKKYD